VAARSATPARVLLTGAEHHYVVAAARALRRSGFRVTTAASTRPALGHLSRAADTAVWLPDAHRDPEGHVDALESVLRSRRHDVVVPGDEASLLAIAAATDRLEQWTRLGLPSSMAVAASLDKIRQLEWAVEAGIRTPPTTVCHDEAEAVDAARSFGYPVVLKPRRSQVPADEGLRLQRSIVVDDEAALRTTLPLVGTPFLVQCRIARGRVFSFPGVAADGTLLAFAFSRYRRTWPPGAGSASFAETLAPPAELATKVLDFVRRAGHAGVFEIEFVGPDRDHLSLIDFNPRLYGSLSLAVAAGADLPTAWCRWLLGERRAPMVARAGFAYRWEEGELRNVLERLGRRRFRAAAEIVRPRPRVTHALFRWDDPRPFVAQFGALVTHRLRGAGRGR